ALELPASLRGLSREKSGAAGTLYSILSITVFLFLLACWVTLAPGHAARAPGTWICARSALALLAGAIFGIAGIVYRRTPGTLVISIVGLCLNGLGLVGMILVILS